MLELVQQFSRISHVKDSENVASEKMSWSVLPCFTRSCTLPARDLLLAAKDVLLALLGGGGHKCAGPRDSQLPEKAASRSGRSPC